MTVTIVRSAGNRGSATQFFRLNGTIQEVLDELANQGVTALNNIDWSDDNTNAVSVFCKQK